MVRRECSMGGRLMVPLFHASVLDAIEALAMRRGLTSMSWSLSKSVKRKERNEVQKQAICKDEHD
jgi:hypothetical protein